MSKKVAIYQSKTAENSDDCTQSEKKRKLLNKPNLKDILE